MKRRPLYLVFWSFGPSFNGETLDERPLGGTETALILTAKSLAALGERVVVYCACERPGRYAGVEYRRNEAIEQHGEPIDVLVAVRDLFPLTIGLRRRLAVYFSPDAYTQRFVRGLLDFGKGVEGTAADLIVPSLAELAGFYDFVFTVGRWQGETFVRHLGLAAERLFVTRNGLEPRNFPPPPGWEGRACNLVYSSTPFRGLDVLLDLFPHVRREVPEAELHVFSGMQLYGLSDEEDRAGFGPLYDRARQEGVVLHGPVRQAELASFLARSRLLAYPNTFDETFCIAVLEAQAAGLPVVTTAAAALTERVEHGVDGWLIDPPAHGQRYQAEFVAACVRYLTERPLWERSSSAARAKAIEFTYDTLARSWLDFFDRIGVSDRPASSPRLSSRDLPPRRSGDGNRFLARETQAAAYLEELAKRGLGRAARTFF